jgi:lipopolysaccharide assembly outer membrane protein LptD (OstA)
MYCYPSTQRSIAKPLSMLCITCGLLGLPWMARIARADATNRPPVLIQADIQEANADKSRLTARGNVVVSSPQYQIDGRADEVLYSSTNQQVILTGNVRLVQRGKILQGTKVVCNLKTGQCLASEG